MNSEFDFMKLAVDQYTNVELDALNDNPSKLFCREPHRPVVENEYERYVKLSPGMHRPKELPASFGADIATKRLMDVDSRGFDLGMLKILVLVLFCGMLFFGGFYAGRTSMEKDTRTIPPQIIERPIINNPPPKMEAEPKNYPVFAEPDTNTKIFPITR